MSVDFFYFNCVCSSTADSDVSGRKTSIGSTLGQTAPLLVFIISYFLGRVLRPLFTNRNYINYVVSPNLNGYSLATVTRSIVTIQQSQCEGLKDLGRYPG